MDLGELTERGYAIKKQIEGLEEQAKTLGEELKQVQEQMMVKMKDVDMTSFKHAHCTVILNTRFTVKHPNEPQDRQAFYNYLKEKKIFEDMVSVHSQRLNSWYKEEMEVAKQKGDFDFKIPGIGEPSAIEYITFRKV